MQEAVEGQENFPVSAGFELTIQGLLVQEHNYSATTHSPMTLAAMDTILIFIPIAEHVCENYLLHPLLNTLLCHYCKRGSSQEIQQGVLYVCDCH